MKTATHQSARTSHEARAFCESLENRVLLSAAWAGGNWIHVANHGQGASVLHQRIGHTPTTSARATPAGVFVQPQLPADVSQQIVVTRGGLRFDRATQLFVQSITLKNVTASAVAGPVVLHLDINQAAGSPDNQAYLLQVNKIGLTNLLFTDQPDFFGHPQVENVVAKTLKHVIIVKPGAADSFAPGEAITITLGFRNDPFNSGLVASQTPGFTYSTRVEQLVVQSAALNYAVTADTAPAQSPDISNVTVPNKDDFGTNNKSTLTITNTGTQPVFVPDLAVEPAYIGNPAFIGAGGTGNSVVHPTPHLPLLDAAATNFTTTPVDGPTATHPSISNLVAVIPAINATPGDLNNSTFTPYAAYFYSFNFPDSSNARLLPAGKKIVVDLFQDLTPNKGTSKVSGGYTHVWRR